MHEIDTPITRACSAYAASSPARFHMPGHKGRGGISPYDALDLTELGATGSAMEGGDDVFSAAFREASALYGTSATVYSAGGATLALQGAIALASRRVKRFACFRAIHRSVINAFALLGIDPVWISGPEEIPDNAAVVVTSPDYYGRMADIRRLSDAAHRRGGLLVVDCAHGAHLAFYDGGRLHPLRNGADLAADSLHKTLPALTGSALLHAMGGVTAEECLSAMRLFGSTSPSYLINLSTERCLSLMSREGEKLHAGLLARLSEVRRRLSEMGFTALSSEPRDPFRLVLRMENARDIAARLEDAGVIPEFADSRHIVTIPSVMTSDSDLERLLSALERLRDIVVRSPEPEDTDAAPPLRPEKAMTLRQAALSPHVTVAAARSAGMICGEAATPYPPGVPAVMPGEIISREAAELLVSSGVMTVSAVAK